MKTTARRRDFIKGAAGLAAGLLAGSCLDDASDTSIRQPGTGPSGGDNPARKRRTMIVDSHAYVFPPGDEPAGHASPREHLSWIQAAHAGHHQPAWRVRDRAPASSKPLAPTGFKNLSDLPDVNFRVDRERGRVVWTVDGEDYTKQFYPPNLRNLEFTPHSLIAEMDYAGVDVTLLHTDPMLIRDSRYLADSVQLYPDRLRSMAPVDEWRIPSETDAVIQELDKAINEYGLHAIKFIPPLGYLGSSAPWDDGPYRPFWEAATSWKVPVFFTARDRAPCPWKTSAAGTSTNWDS